MDQRRQFVTEFLSGEYSMTELCERYGVSRQTGYQTLARWWRDGDGGLETKSHAPRRCPHKTSAAVEQALLEARATFGWGARKLLEVVRAKHPELADELPSPSTGAEILRRHGKSKARRRRRSRPPTSSGVTQPTEPNHVWTADFKGEFKTRDGKYCFPLTVVDDFSRNILACHGQLSTEQAQTQTVFDRLFRKHGLPHIIRTDNGTPFAASGVARLSKLAVWWIKLGIQVERIAVGQPSQNGRHERMHRSLKEACAKEPEHDLRAQQQRFDDFVHTYNFVRGHEGIGMATPASLYRPSPRPFPDVIAAPEYPLHWETRLVASNGCVRWKTATLFLSSTLAGELVGFHELDDGIWAVLFYDIELGRYNARTNKLNYGGIMGPHRANAVSRPL